MGTKKAPLPECLKNDIIYVCENYIFRSNLARENLCKAVRYANTGRFLLS